VFQAKPEGMIEWGHYARTLFPLLALPLATLAIMAHPLRSRLPSTVSPWLVYGMIGLGTSFASPDPLGAAYWALCYLAVIAALWYYLTGTRPLDRAVELNQLTWLITTAFLLALLAVAREQLVEHISASGSGYGVYGQVKTAAGAGVSRASGMARFLAVPGIVAFVRSFSSRGLARVWWGLVAAGCGVLLMAMQSRGAMVAYVFAVLFAMIVLRPTTRVLGALLIALMGLTLALQFTQETLPDDSYVRKAAEYFRRGQSEDDLYSMTGRVRDWKTAWGLIKDSPVWGYGFQADRHLIGQHVHNTYLYALLTAGILGTVPFLYGLGRAWLALVRVLKGSRNVQHAFVVQVGAILAFFTVRSIPEVSGTLFTVDLMVMLPGMAYLGILERQREDRRLPRNGSDAAAPRCQYAPEVLTGSMRRV